MASRILHLAVAKKIIEKRTMKDENRFKLGVLLPDVYAEGMNKADSHFKIVVCEGKKKTYDLTCYKRLYKQYMKSDDLYLGYYLHLIQDMIYRKMIYNKYKWNPMIPGNVKRLHNDFHILNQYVIEKYGLHNDLVIPSDFSSEKINEIYPFGLGQFMKDIHDDFTLFIEDESFFFTKAMTEEFIEEAVTICLKEMEEFFDDRSFIDEFTYAW